MNCTITGTGRLHGDPELRFTPQGKAVCELKLMVSNSIRDPKTKEYRYSPTIWLSVTLWEGMAENAAETLRAKDEVLFSGQLEKEEFEKRDGTKGDKLVLKFGEVAPSIRRGPVVTRERSDNRPLPTPRQQQRQARPVAAPPPPPADPWASVPGGTVLDRMTPAQRTAAAYDEPPF